MGYRTTMISEDLYRIVPDWFYDKYKDRLHFGNNEDKPGFPISSRYERKFYDGAKEELFIDLARVVSESTDDWWTDIVLVLLHEDEQISKVRIQANKITLQHLEETSELGNNWQIGDGEVYEIKPPVTEEQGE